MGIHTRNCKPWLKSSWLGRWWTLKTKLLSVLLNGQVIKLISNCFCLYTEVSMALNLSRKDCFLQWNARSHNWSKCREYFTVECSVPLISSTFISIVPPSPILRVREHWNKRLYERGSVEEGCGMLFSGHGLVMSSQTH